MAVTAKAFSVMPLSALKKLINDLNAAGTVVKCALYTDAAAPTQEMANKTALDAVCTEVSGTGYTAGGATLANKAVTEATRVTKFDADDVEWTSSTLTAMYAVLYETENLLIWVDFSENKSSENGTFKIQWNASGIFTITVA
ncbi:hypothetical protein ES708_25264 [subsurface metagenome]